MRSCWIASFRSVIKGDAKSSVGGAASVSNADSRQGVYPKKEMNKLEGTSAITNGFEGGSRATPEQKMKGLGRVVVKDGKFTR